MTAGGPSAKGFASTVSVHCQWTTRLVALSIGVVKSHGTPVQQCKVARTMRYTPLVTGHLGTGTAGSDSGSTGLPVALTAAAVTLCSC